MVKNRKVHSLTGRITIELMRAAFKKVKRNRGAAGVDKVSIGMFKDNLEQNLLALMKDLKSGEFRPVPLRRVHLSKGPHTKKTRPLGIPGVRDRVGQEVLRRLLEPIFESLFQEASFGFRPKRNCHQAIQWVLSLHDAGYGFVLEPIFPTVGSPLSGSLLRVSSQTQLSSGDPVGVVPSRRRLRLRTRRRH